MKIPLFQFVDDTIDLFNSKQAAYEYVEGRMKTMLASLFNEKDDSVVLIRSRIKNPDSLREKLIRNRFYMDYPDPIDTLNHVTDIVGITMECRFIRNEAELFQKLFRYYRPYKGNDYQSIKDENAFLNLKMPQPQTQRNGFTIYRMDGYYLFNGERISYALQIKSLVPNFWSELEHDFVSKNPDFFMYEAFNKDMLGAIRDNLDVVDRQLEIMYNEISMQSRNAQIGMDENGFKVFVAGSVNELVNRKMKESLGFATDFRKCSSSIAQYIYVRDFVNGNHNQIRMIDYLQLLNDLNSETIDFTQQLHLERVYTHVNPFCNIVGSYMETRLNVDFQWHVFFMMIFLLRSGNNLEDFSDFIEIYYRLVVQPAWLDNPLASFSESEAFEIRTTREQIFGDILVEAGSFKMLYEENMYNLMQCFRNHVNEMTEKCHDMNSFREETEQITADIRKDVKDIFAK